MMEDEFLETELRTAQGGAADPDSLIYNPRKYFYNSQVGWANPLGRGGGFSR